VVSLACAMAQRPSCEACAAGRCLGSSAKAACGAWDTLGYPVSACVRAL
jgi:hypothetical protein